MHMGKEKEESTEKEAGKSVFQKDTKQNKTKNRREIATERVKEGAKSPER